MSKTLESQSDVIRTAETLSAIGKDKTLCGQMDEVTSTELKLALALAELILRRAALKMERSGQTVN